MDEIDSQFLWEAGKSRSMRCASGPMVPADWAITANGAPS
jgi:hypothetical protein